MTFIVALQRYTIDCYIYTHTRKCLAFYDRINQIAIKLSEHNSEMLQKGMLTHYLMSKRTYIVYKSINPYQSNDDINVTINGKCSVDDLIYIQRIIHEYSDFMID